MGGENCLSQAKHLQKRGLDVSIWTSVLYFRTYPSFPQISFGNSRELPLRQTKALDIMKRPGEDAIVLKRGSQEFARRQPGIEARPAAIMRMISIFERLVQGRLEAI